MKQLHAACTQAINAAQALQANQANKKRLPAPAFKPGDTVFLDVRYLPRQRPTLKIDNVRAGPYKIISMKTPLIAVLRLPDGSNISNEFHVSKLRPASPDAFPVQHDPQPDPVIVNSNHEPEYEVERIIDSRIRRRSLQYLVKWVGYSAPTWEPQDNMANAPQAVADFHQQFPTAATSSTIALTYHATARRSSRSSKGGVMKGLHARISCDEHYGLATF